LKQADRAFAVELRELEVDLDHIAAGSQLPTR
jgi:hypothetical protein